MMGPQIDESTPLIQVESVNETRERLNDETQTLTKLSPRRYVVFVIFLCYFLAGGIFANECPQYTQHRVIEKYNHLENSSTHEGHNRSICYVNKTSPSYVLFTHIQQETATWSMYYPLASKIPALVASLVWSSYSDILGRKVVFIVCLTGTTIRMCLFASVVLFELSLGYIVLGGVIDGVSGSFTTLFAVMFSYISDITLPGKRRTVMIVLCDLIRSMAITASSVISGYMITHVGFLTPALLCVVIEVIGLLVAICLLPETIHRRGNNVITATKAPREHTSGVKHAFGVVSETVKFYIKGGPGNKRLKYILLILGFLFFGMPNMNRSAMETLYLLGRPFCWTATKIGWFHAIKTAVSATCAMLITYVFRKQLADDTIAAASLISVGVSYIVEGLADNEYVLYSVPVLTALSTLPIPMIRSLMSSLTSPDKQGAMYAGVGFVESLCTLIGAVSNNTIYSATMTILNGFVFLLMSMVTFISAAILVAFMVINRTDRASPDKDDSQDTIEMK